MRDFMFISNELNQNKSRRSIILKKPQDTFKKASRSLSSQPYTIISNQSVMSPGPISKKRMIQMFLISNHRLHKKGQTRNLPGLESNKSLGFWGGGPRSLLFKLEALLEVEFQCEPSKDKVLLSKLLTLIQWLKYYSQHTQLSHSLIEWRQQSLPRLTLIYWGDKPRVDTILQSNPKQYIFTLSLIDNCSSPSDANCQTLATYLLELMEFWGKVEFHSLMQQYELGKDKVGQSSKQSDYYPTDYCYDFNCVVNIMRTFVKHNANDSLMYIGGTVLSSSSDEVQGMLMILENFSRLTQIAQCNNLERQTKPKRPFNLYTQQPSQLVHVSEYYSSKYFRIKGFTWDRTNQRLRQILFQVFIHGKCPDFFQQLKYIFMGTRCIGGSDCNDAVVEATQKLKGQILSA